MGVHPEEQVVAWRIEIHGNDFFCIAIHNTSFAAGFFLTSFASTVHSNSRAG
jgi:hypothetical protein